MLQLLKLQIMKGVKGYQCTLDPVVFIRVFYLQSSSPAAVSELSPRPSNRPFFAVRADHFTSSHTLSARTHTHTRTPLPPSLPPSALLGADR